MLVNDGFWPFPASHVIEIDTWRISVMWLRSDT